jgi:hypothetical protein
MTIEQFLVVFGITMQLTPPPSSIWIIFVNNKKYKYKLVYTHRSIGD